MARTAKNGIGYFPLDTDFFQDEKIQFVSARFGMKGEAITVRLLCKIYRNGYYVEFNDDTALLFAKSVGDGCQDSLVKDVVQELLKRGFFNKSIFERFGILTGRSIQNRYFEAVKRYKKVDAVREYLLVDVSEMINVNINSENVNINSENVNINSQKRREREKEKERERESERPHAREVKSDTDFFSVPELKNLCSEIWLETVGMKLHVTPENLKAFFDEFCDTQEVKDYTNSINDFKSHFINWLKINIKKEKSSGKKESSGGAPAAKPDKLKQIIESHAIVAERIRKGEI